MPGETVQETTRNRPVSILVLGCLFILVGIGGVIGHWSELNQGPFFNIEVIGPLLVRLLAVLGGVFVLLGANWARWLLVAWAGYHVVLSVFHPIGELAMHVLILTLVCFFLFRPSASKYFRSPGV